MKRLFPLAALVFLLACIAPPWIAPIPTATIPPVETPKILATKTATPWTAEVRLPTVNVRACAGCAEVLRQLRAGDAVTLVRCVYTPELGDWCQIKPKGWIYRGCLSINSGLGCSSN
jgi:hypothetical protein